MCMFVKSMILNTLHIRVPRGFVDVALAYSYFAGVSSTYTQRYIGIYAHTHNHLRMTITAGVCHTSK
jgi:hypothetical protein